MKAIIVLTLVFVGCLATSRELFEVHEIPGEVEITHRKVKEPEQQSAEPQKIDLPIEEDEETLNPTHRQYVNEPEIETIEESSN